MPDPSISAAAADMQQMISRADEKAATLLAGTVAAVALIASSASHDLSPALRVTGGLALAALLAAGGLLLAVVLPRGTAHLNPADHLAAFRNDEKQIRQYERLATTARRKFRLVGHAVRALYAGGALLGAAAALNTI